MKAKVALAAAAVVLAAGLLWVVVVRPAAGPGRPQPAYHESPMMRERVERGDLPPVEQRLPEHPLVVEPTEGIGRYDSSPRSAPPATPKR